MNEFADLLDEVIAVTSAMFALQRGPKAGKGHDCDDCGAARPDVDLYAEDSETSEELWLCLECGCKE